MGLSSSKQVSRTLTNSPDFNSVCDSVYEETTSLTQQSFPGIKPYQLSSASDRLHHTLASLHFPLIDKWVPNPPTRSQVDNAFRAISTRSTVQTEITSLDRDEFKEFAIHLFADVIDCNAGKAVLRRVPIGVAGIVGIGGLTRSGKELIGIAIGLYTLGVSTSIYVGLAQGK